MTFDDLTATSVPFLFSLLIQLLGRGVRVYANRRVRDLAPGQASEAVTPRMRQLGVDLAVRIYTQLGFLFGMLGAGISSITYTASDHPGCAAWAAFVLFAVVAIWFVFWEGLSAAEIEGREGLPMQITSWAAIIFLWAITLYARSHPAIRHSPTIS
jgi:hypothetical protein